DVARHFFSVDDVKRFADLIARYEFNRLHLHLTDDQGWRIEVRSWPRLAEVGGGGAVGGGPGGWYTQEQYAELVAVCAERGGGDRSSGLRALHRARSRDRAAPRQAPRGLGGDRACQAASGDDRAALEGRRARRTRGRPGRRARHVAGDEDLPRHEVRRDDRA